MTSPDTLQVRCLLEALNRYSAADYEERTEREKYDGYSWGHFGYHLIEAREKAAIEFMGRLNDYIDSRIQAALLEERS